MARRLTAQRNATPLSSAMRLIEKKKYAKAKELLLASVLANNQDAQAYAALAIVCVYLKQYDEAETFAEKALFIDALCARAMHANAYLKLIMGDAPGALQCYFRILEIEPKDEIATANIERIREIKNLNGAIPFLRADDFFRPPRTRSAFKFALIAALIAAAGALIACFFIFVYPVLMVRLELTRNNPARKELADLALFEGRPDKAILIGEYTPAQIDRMFVRAKQDILEGKINKARSAINEVNRSSASQYYKEKFLLLTNYIVVPDYGKFIDPLSYEEAMSDPSAYAGCVILWEGDINQKKKEKNGVQFSFLMKRADDGSVIGIVNAFIEGELSAPIGQRVEVYGVFKGVTASDKRAVVEAALVKHKK